MLGLSLTTSFLIEAHFNIFRYIIHYDVPKSFEGNGTFEYKAFV